MSTGTSDAGRLASVDSPALRPDGPSATPGPLIVRTVAVAGPGPLLDLLPPEHPFAWVRGGEGLVGWGRAAEVRPTGADRFTRASAWWADLVGTAVVRDEVRLPGSGLVAFGSFAFADEPGEDRKSTRLNSSHVKISYAVFCLKKKNDNL